MPNEALCLGCGYLLRGLERPVCPECGREFDPQDICTFDVDPQRLRRRKWIKRTALVLAVVALVYLLYPRGHITYSISFTCQRCGASTIIKRWQPKQPKWIPILYPGWRWSLGDSTPARTAGCPGHRYNVVVDFKDNASGGGAFGEEQKAIPKRFMSTTTPPRLPTRRPSSEQWPRKAASRSAPDLLPSRSDNAAWCETGQRPDRHAAPSRLRRRTIGTPTRFRDIVLRLGLVATSVDRSRLEPTA